MPKGVIDIKRRLERKKLMVGDCWRYRDKLSSNGYAMIWYMGKRRLVHRVSAHVFLGFNLYSELYILHSPECKFKDCWNPAHLRPGTQSDNMRDARLQGNRTQSAIEAFLGDK